MKKFKQSWRFTDNEEDKRFKIFLITLYRGINSFKLANEGNVFYENFEDSIITYLEEILKDKYKEKLKEYVKEI